MIFYIHTDPHKTVIFNLRISSVHSLEVLVSVLDRQVLPFKAVSYHIIMAPKRKQTDSGKGKKVSKVHVKDESDNEIEASDESNAENESDDEVSIPEEAGDGLADMMSKILNQNIGTKVCSFATDF